MIKQSHCFYHSRLLPLIALLLTSYYESSVVVFGTDIVVSMGGDELNVPESYSSSDGLLDIELSIQYANFAIVDRENDNTTVFSMTNTRLFDGMLPGKTLYVSPGDKMMIKYKNELEFQPNANNAGLNIMGYPDHSNLHFHGAHVSGELPSDDIRMKVKPQGEYQYETNFPENHMGGTAWMHPHVHGSSALQVGGGAANALIVRDDNTGLPPILQNATDIVLMVQDINVDEINAVISKSRDEKLQLYRNDSAIPNSFRMVNGQYKPYYNMIPEEWVRFRVIYGGWLTRPLELAFEGCDVALLAKDGVYIRDFPRTIQNHLPIPTGGRADVIVRCNTPDTVHQVTDYSSKTVFELRVLSATTSSSSAPKAVASWTPNYPAYLEDLCEAEVTSGCSCETVMRDCPTEIVVAGGFDEEHKCINGEIFDPDRYIHSIPFGATVERFLKGNRIHPYHQHVHPFQLCNQYSSDTSEQMSAQNKEYFQINDWHDVWSSRTGDSAIGQQVRFRPNVHFGRLMVHCHVLSHEDEGTMSQEFIGDPTTTECDCTPVPARGGGNGGASNTCFSSTATANVYNKGRVAMKDLIVGDKVLTSNGEYQTLFSMNHYHTEKETVFLQIITDLPSEEQQQQPPLELSPNHLLFVVRENNSAAATTKTTYYPVPASSIKVGNKVQTIDGENTVIEINTIVRDGLYNPLTTDGTIVVNGIVASTYTSPNGNSNIEIISDNSKKKKHYLLLSFHDALHMVSAPYRQLCLTVSLDLCNLHDELSIASSFVESFFNFWSQQNNYYVRWFIYSIYVLFFGILEQILLIMSPSSSSSSPAITIGKFAAAIGGYLYYYYYSFGFAKKHKICVPSKQKQKQTK